MSYPAQPGVLVVIPARYESRRFPGKVLAPLAGRPLIVHVIERARQARCAADVLVATDDERIRTAAEEAGAPVVMTASHHPSGTDRIAEVAAIRPEPIIVNVQGDEPLLPGAAIDRLVEALAQEPGWDMATLAHPFGVGSAAPSDPNAVKVVCSQSGRALYFSRNLVPAGQGAEPLRHMGVYAYRRPTLLKLAGLAPTPLEESERLEQLRALEHDIPMGVVTVGFDGPGVDTPADLERVQAHLTQSCV